MNRDDHDVDDVDRTFASVISGLASCWFSHQYQLSNHDDHDVDDVDYDAAFLFSDPACC